jgi:hypothetical protein
MKTKRLTVSLLAMFGFAVFLPQIDAVVPPPDGGYPGFTTAEGTNALKNLTTGAANTTTGWYSLFTNSTGITILALVRELSYLTTENKTPLLVWQLF